MKIHTIVVILTFRGQKYVTKNQFNFSMHRNTKAKVNNMYHVQTKMNALPHFLYWLEGDQIVSHSKTIGHHIIDKTDQNHHMPFQVLLNYVIIGNCE